MTGSSQGADRRRRSLLVAAGLAAVAVLVATLPLRQWLVALAESVERAGPSGAVAFTACYALGTVVFVPRAALNLLAGWLFGGVLGTALAVLASMVGSVIAFLIGRRLLPDAIDAALSRISPLRALDVVARRHPIRLTMLWHLSLVLPFALINYYMGAIRVRLVDFLIGKAIGVFPATTAYVLVGTLLPDLVAFAAGELPAEGARIQLVAATIGVAFTVGMVVWIGRASGRLLRQLDQGQPDASRSKSISSISSG